MKHNAKTYIAISAVCLVAILTVVLYAAGYRFQDNYTLGKLGVLSGTMPLQNTSLFVDTSQKITTTRDNEKITIKLSPKTHLILVSRPGYFPWAKNVTVPSGNLVTITPVLVTQNTTGQIITPKDPEYLKIKHAVQVDVLPTKENPKISNDGTTRLWVEDNAIVVQTGETIKTVVQPDTLVKNVAFYKDRSDAVLFSSAGNVFVIETDTENTQNILPIYKGQNPYFIETSPNYIYVLEGNTLMAVVI